MRGRRTLHGVSVERKLEGTVGRDSEPVSTVALSACQVERVGLDETGFADEMISMAGGEIDEQRRSH